MADPHAHDDYVRGSMEIQEQKSTYDLFMVLSKYGSLGIAVLLTFLTIGFMYDGSLLVGAGAAIVLLAVGIFFLRSPKKH
ncbi:aa3-type cytochrome c oxidase subunit IV [Brevundimonas sp. M20]|uniref:aa3-type cytochrome c oxidase subunit IV n=1 Tax=Brevundimonas sp. M20 TaxID=2591463 RepID=UPI0011478A1A|nr:aa3-type cytochrome c oxidase subunit IV [Brevundimonas sp. M20]QDH73886.1 aa3-type cytochrome c oxidase subunit IV [Brevundimonas sp. M20]